MLSSGNIELLATMERRVHIKLFVTKS